MSKAFCIVGIKPKGAPFAKADASLGPLIDAARAARVSGVLDGVQVSEVYVLASTSIGPVCKYKCAAPVAAPSKPRKGKD